MKTIDIYINGKLVDVSEELRVVVDKIVSEYRNPTKKTGSYSYTTELPATQRNKVVFDYQNDRSVVGKFRKNYTCTVLVDDIEVISGSFELSRVTKTKFEGSIIGSGDGRLADLIPEGKKLRDIKSFTPVDFTGDAYVWNKLDAQLDADTSDIAFPFIFDSFARIKGLNSYVQDNVTLDLSYDDFGISHFARNVFRNIFTDAGYTLQGNVLQDERFKRLLLLYTNDQDLSPYNYPALNPCTATPFLFQANPHSIVDTQTYSMYVVTPEILTGAGEKSGDLSFSLGGDGVYTCKYTSEYTFDIDLTSHVHVNVTGLPKLETKQFLVFREIGSSQYSQGNNLEGTAYSDIQYANIVDGSTLNDSGEVTSTVSSNVWTHTAGFTVKLEEGKQYAPQIYVFIKTAEVSADMRFVVDHTVSHLNITEVAGDPLLHVEKFLPDMTQLEFVQAMFKMFSLFYSVDDAAKVINLYTRDEWYALNKNNILDLSDKLSLDEFEETPLTETEAAETYYRWAADEGDHLLTHTDYMDEVNGDISEEAYELPFAPLAFLDVNIYKNLDEGMISYVIGSDLIPASIPATESVDMSVTEDFSASSNRSHKPKICLYYGSGFLKNEVFTTDRDGVNSYLLSFGRTKGLTSPLMSSDRAYKELPRLTFFDIDSQPGYKVVIDQATRSFRLEKTVGTNIISVNYDTFILAAGAGDVMNAASLGMTGDKSLFQDLYRNDILVSEWSNYSEGTLRTDSVLFAALNGRNIIRVEDDLYLLDSIRSYELTGDTAKIKLYKMLSA